MEEAVDKAARGIIATGRVHSWTNARELARAAIAALSDTEEKA